MARVDRPLSPHLDIYRWQVSNTLSILHRMTGVFLSLGAVAFVIWLVSVGAGVETYSRVNAVLQGPIGVLLLLGWTFSFFYHLCNGVRHLAWDIGLGFEPEFARKSGWLVIILATVLTIGFALVALSGGGS